MALLAPAEVEENPRTKQCIERILAEDNPISEVHYLNLRQSMRNGGGPACLRLRIVLTDKQFEAMDQGVLLTEYLHQQLVS